jgi:hypothetical protein
MSDTTGVSFRGLEGLDLEARAPMGIVILLFEILMLV